LMSVIARKRLLNTSTRNTARLKLTGDTAILNRRGTMSETDDDAKEWVTVKVPKRVRDEAREDPRTYGEILRAGMDSDVSQASPDELREQLETMEKKIEQVQGAQADTVREALQLAEDDNLREQLDRIEAGVEAIEDHLGARYG